MKVGILEFEFVGNPTLLEVHVFDVPQYEGEPVETEGNSSLPSSNTRIWNYFFSAYIW
jgi:hypothetical protein